MRIIFSILFLVLAYTPLSASYVYEHQPTSSYEFSYAYTDTCYSAYCQVAKTTLLKKTNDTAIQLKAIKAPRMYRSKMRNYLLTNACLRTILNPLKC